MDIEDVKSQMLAKVKLAAIGNSDRKLKDVAQDLVNASGMSFAEVAHGCFLCTSTVKKLARGSTSNPQSETIERVFRFFNMRVDLSGEPIKEKYANRKKEKV